MVTDFTQILINLNKVKKEMLEEIENKYCVYENFVGIALGFGKIIREEERLVTIRESERTLNIKLWNKKFIERFDTLEGAIKNYIKNQTEGDCQEMKISSEEIWHMAKVNFPSHFEEKNYEKRN